MSIFPTGAPGSARRTAVAGRDAGIDTDGVLVQPISGQIYLIEESDLDALSDGATRASLSGLVNRH